MKKILTILAFSLPAVAYAQQVTDITSLSYKLTNIGNNILVLLISFAVIYIVFRVVQFIMAGEAEKRAEIRTSILWGIVGLAIIVSIWGLVKILTNTARVDNNAPTRDYPLIDHPPIVP